MNLHPAWQKQLAIEILCGQEFKQCFISTHSLDFLDEFTEDLLNDKIAIFAFDPSSKTSSHFSLMKAGEVKRNLNASMQSSSF